MGKKGKRRTIPSLCKIASNPVPPRRCIFSWEGVAGMEPILELLHTDLVDNVLCKDQPTAFYTTWLQNTHKVHGMSLHALGEDPTLPKSAKGRTLSTVSSHRVTARAFRHCQGPQQASFNAKKIAERRSESTPTYPSPDSLGESTPWIRDQLFSCAIGGNFCVRPAHTKQRRSRGAAPT